VMEYLLDDNALVDVCQTLRRANPTLIIATGNSAAATETDIFGHTALAAIPAVGGHQGTVKRGGQSLAAAQRPPARTNLTKVLADQHDRYCRALLSDSDEDSPPAKKSRHEAQHPSDNGGPTSTVPPYHPLHSRKSRDQQGHVAVAADAVAWEIFARRMAREQRLALKDPALPPPGDAARVPSFHSMTAGHSGGGGGSSSAAAGGAQRRGGGNHLCSVCLMPAPYRCARCKTAVFCSIRCSDIHEDTRCLKHLA
jgi:zinc finger HIT domain-containing protein 1